MPELYNSSDLLARDSLGVANMTRDKENFANYYGFDPATKKALFGKDSYDQDKFRTALNALQTNNPKAFDQLTAVDTAYVPGTKSIILVDMTTKLDQVMLARKKAIEDSEPKYTWPVIGGIIVGFIGFMATHARQTTLELVEINGSLQQVEVAVDNFAHWGNKWAGGAALLAAGAFVYFAGKFTTKDHQFDLTKNQTLKQAVRNQNQRPSLLADEE